MEDNGEDRLRMATHSASPWLLYTHAENNNKMIQTFSNFTTMQTHSYVDTIPALQGKLILCACNGCLILRNVSENNKLYLWNPSSLRLIELGTIDHPDFVPTVFINACVLVDNPEDDHSFIVLMFFECFVFGYRRGNWASQRLLLDGSEAKVDQAILISDQVVSVVARCYYPNNSCDSHLATLDLELIGDKVKISGNLSSMNLKMPFPKEQNIFPLFTSFRTLLIECDGLVYAVGRYNIGSDKYTSFVGIKLWELDSKSMCWVEIDCIGDRAFFINCDNGSTNWCWANSDVGIQPNSVYLLASKEGNTVYVYDLQKHSLTPLCPCTNLEPSWDSSTWVILPHHHNQPRSAKQGGSQALTGNDQQPENTCEERLEHTYIEDDLISLLPTEMTSLISKKLHLFDYLSFREACKSVRSQLSLPQWRSHNSLPLFLFSSRKGGLCQTMDPCRNDRRSISLPLPSSCESFILCSKNGWLIHGRRSLKYLNLFTRVEGDLPYEGDKPLFRCLGFSSSPTSTDCLTIGIYGWTNATTITYHYQGQDWDDRTFTSDDLSSKPWTSSPIYIDGKFYFLYENGKVGAFELRQGQPNLVAYEEPVSQTSTYFKRSHLVECNGQILTALIGDTGRWVQVFKLDHSKQDYWVEVKDLGNNVLFVNQYSSFAAAAPKPEMRNRIYLSRLYRDHLVYYSMETGKFHTFDNNHTMDDLYGTEAPLRCCWV